MLTKEPCKTAIIGLSNAHRKKQMSKVTLANVGSLIDATTAKNTINSNMAAIMTAMENTLSRDGTYPSHMLADLDMNSNRILNLPAPVSGLEPFRLTDAQSLILSKSTGAVDNNSYTSVSVAALSNISASVTGIFVYGFAAVGDGGAAHYKKVVSATTGIYSFLSADGARWQIAESAIDPRMVGAKGDGATNDAPAMQIAVDTAAKTCGKVVVSKGNYILNARINFPTTAGEALVFTGSGGAYFTRGASYTSGALFYIANNPNPLSSWLDISNITIIAANGAYVTGGYAIEIVNRENVRLTDIFIYDGFGGVSLATAGTIYLNNVFYLQSSTYATTLGISSAGFVTSGTISAIFINNCGFVGNNTQSANCLSYGIYVGAADGIQISNTFVGGTEGIHFEGNATSSVNDVYISNLVIDNCRTAAVNFQGNASGGKIYTNIRFANSHINVRNDSLLGTGINVNITGNVDFVTFVGCNINLSYGVCVNIEGVNSYTGTPRQSIKFIGCDISANCVSGAWPIVALANGTSGVSFVDCDLCNRSGSITGAATYGITLAASNADIKVIGCTLTNLVTGTIFPGSGTHTGIIIKNNRGIDDIVGSVTCAASITVPFNPVFQVTGAAVNISTILGGWRGREIIIINNTNTASALTFVSGGNIWPPTSTIVTQRATKFVYDGTVWRSLS